jgi:hypothetical protein
MGRERFGRRYRDAIGVLLPDALCLGLALFKRMFVLKLGFHPLQSATDPRHEPYLAGICGCSDGFVLMMRGLSRSEGH